MSDEPKVGEVWEVGAGPHIGRLGVVEKSYATSVMDVRVRGVPTLHRYWPFNLKRRVELREGQVWRNPSNSLLWDVLLTPYGQPMLKHFYHEIYGPNIADMVREGWTLVSEPEEQKSPHCESESALADLLQKLIDTDPVVAQRFKAAAADLQHEGYYLGNSNTVPWTDPRDPYKKFTEAHNAALRDAGQTPDLPDELVPPYKSPDPVVGVVFSLGKEMAERVGGLSRPHLLSMLPRGSDVFEKDGHVTMVVPRSTGDAEIRHIDTSMRGRFPLGVTYHIKRAGEAERHVTVVTMGADEYRRKFDAVYRKPIDMRPLAEAFAEVARCMQTPRGIVILNRQWCDEQVANPPRWARDGRGVARGERFEAFKVGLCNEVARHSEPSLVDEWIGRDGKKRFWREPRAPTAVPCSKFWLVTMATVRQYVDQQCGEAPAWV